MDLNQAVNAALVEMVEDGTVKAMVRKTVESTVKGIVESVYGGYSGEFKKGLQSHIEKALAVDLSNLNLSGYNLLVLETIKESLDNVVQTQGIERIRSDMERLLSPLEKTEWNLSEIVEKMKGEENEDNEHWDSKISFEYDDSFSHWAYVHIDPEEGKSKYKCDFAFRIEWFDKNDHSKGGR